jgi:phosphoribosylanthranilate isomerase
MKSADVSHKSGPCETLNFYLLRTTVYMTWVKICGMTNLEDALVAVEAGADAVGFVFCEKSPRNISARTVREIVKKLPEGLEKVGVFVDSNVDEVRYVVLEAGLSAVQLHGGPSGESFYLDQRPTLDCVGVSKAIGMAPAAALQDSGIKIEKWIKEKLFAVLIDSHANGATGGTGTRFDWHNTRGMVQALSLMVPVIVAGGLTATNVGEAIEVLKPWGVDVASGVEGSPGKKDPEKVRAFVQAVRDAERSL